MEAMLYKINGKASRAEFGPLALLNSLAEQIIGAEQILGAYQFALLLIASNKDKRM